MDDEVLMAKKKPLKNQKIKLKKNFKEGLTKLAEKIFPKSFNIKFWQFQYQILIFQYQILAMAKV